MDFTKDEGIRLAPVPGRPHMSRRLIAPTITPVEGGWRMYMEARGPADELTAIASAFSSDPDALEWEFEAGLRLTHPTMGFGGPRYTPLPGGGGRLFLFASVYTEEGPSVRPPPAPPCGFFDPNHLSLAALRRARGCPRASTAPQPPTAWPSP